MNQVGWMCSVFTLGRISSGQGLDTNYGSIQVANVNRQQQLQELTSHLSHLVEILRLDRACQWRPNFERCLEQANSLLSSGFTREDHVDLAVSIIHVYSGGMGSFNDYAPCTYDPETGRYTEIPGTAEFGDFADKVYNAALSLRVVG
ncbi:DUF6966 domain-containing protein [Pedosphaera parvula]|uniref:DUF6966 domain-containing protein n=1 Tax=Pedosphaera parvula (strain Ellin514) TaxID=320771 RepID=B9XBQ0_PEDPL|nr:hypothetical protein [Pedosphaera parvula]EEF62935.1 hypothetical protein Cflav_PD5570 [Pedosphaera parvula Ellin514]